ncbi:thioredoxin [Nocardiopsis gilva YIM 90087]|uniref:Thioredoxin n=1 Tax=Nocardiopsis gilva YIM 90087 TaxID=1235441 RepID=A0A223S625_9ACTN|nr:DsbA family protein [Nocardiopsis gilva]ASU83489.1 thioredoxin [Nocardiopsis gilva YIM 90087]
MGKAERRASRERLKQERLKAQQRAKRNRILGVVGAALVVVLVVVGGGYWYLTSSNTGDKLTADLPPQTLQQDGSVVLAKDGAKAPVVEVYADFQCPACKQFETAAGSTLQQLAADGQAIVHYRPVSIFAQQQAPISSNSLRAAAAARAAADYGKYVEYNDVLFENQPAEGSPGYSVEDLISWGEEVGIDDAAFGKRVEAENKIVDTYTGDYTPKLTKKAKDELGMDKLSTMTTGDLLEWGDDNGVDSSFLDGTYVKETLDATNAVNTRYTGDNKFEGTPSIYLNGSKMGNEAYNPQQLKQAILDADPGEVQSKPLASDEGAQPESEASKSAEPESDDAPTTDESPEAKE